MRALWLFQPYKINLLTIFFLRFYLEKFWAAELKVITALTTTLSLSCWIGRVTPDHHHHHHHHRHHDDDDHHHHDHNNVSVQEG